MKPARLRGRRRARGTRESSCARRNSGVPIATLPRRSRTMMSRTSESTCRRSPSSIFIRRRRRPGSVVEHRAGGLAPRRLHHPRPRRQHRPLKQDVVALAQNRQLDPRRRREQSIARHARRRFPDERHAHLVVAAERQPEPRPNQRAAAARRARAAPATGGRLASASSSAPSRSLADGAQYPLRARTLHAGARHAHLHRMERAVLFVRAAIRQHVVGGRVGGRRRGWRQPDPSASARAVAPPSGRRYRARATAARHRVRSAAVDDAGN